MGRSDTDLDNTVKFEQRENFWSGVRIWDVSLIQPRRYGEAWGGNASPAFVLCLPRYFYPVMQIVCCKNRLSLFIPTMTKFLLNNNHLGIAISMTVFQMFDFGWGSTVDPALELRG